MNNIYRCRTCQQLVVNDELVQEMNLVHIGQNTTVTKNTLKINNLYKSNKEFKNRIKQFSSYHTELKKQLRQAKSDILVLGNNSNLNLYYNLYDTEYKRLKKEISTHATFKVYKKSYNRILKFKELLQTDYGIDFSLYRRNNRGGAKDYIRNIFHNKWTYRPMRIIAKHMRKIRMAPKILGLNQE